VRRELKEILRSMGTFYTGCKAENRRDPKKVVVVPKLLVDSGSEFTWLPAEVLKRIRIEAVKKDLPIRKANGQIVTRDVGYAILRVDKYETTDGVVFGRRGDLLLLGSRALEGMNVHVDARRKRLVAAGPAVAAGDAREIPDLQPLAGGIAPATQDFPRECGGISA
jgi:predicted aspartyl protease